MNKEINDQDSKATVEDVVEPTIVGGNTGSVKPEVVGSSKAQDSNANAQAESPFANLGPNPFSGNPNPFPGMMDASGQPTIPCTESESSDMEKLAQFFASTSDPKETSEVLKDFQKAHPNMRPEVFIAHFPLKMSPLIANLPSEEKFPKLMLMMNAFAAVDPLIGKVMDGLGPIMNGSQPQRPQAVSDFWKDLVDGAGANAHDGQSADQMNSLLTNGPFNEGLDDLSLEELNGMGFGEFSGMSFDELMNFAGNLGINTPPPKEDESKNK